MKKFHFSFILFSCCVASFACAVIASGQSPSHETFDELLHQYVSDEGAVNYNGFIADSLKLNAYLENLSNHAPADGWSENEKIAYWINAYNAFTIRLIIRNYPVKSIKDLGGKLYKINTPWDIKFIHIGDETYDLNNIENSILRKQFKEPRIHFALNCASKSCPPLRREAYSGSKLDAQLNEQARKFINNPKFNIIKEHEAELSKIFSWYRGDFSSPQMSFEAFISQWSPEVITSETDISYMAYDWSLNE